jgi:hypothetical protein
VLFLTSQNARAAIGLAIPTIDQCMEQGLTDGRGLHIVAGLRVPDSRGGFTGSLVSEYSIGDPDTWRHDFRLIAHGKLQLTARTGLPTRVVQLDRPELLQHDDIKYWGSAIKGDAIVACSGVQSRWDETFADIILRLWLAQTEDTIVALRDDEESDTY